ncbi:filamentous hemagglutinin family outer membrane protein [Leptolyngbya sp. Heron Island J]|nr:filamentous hemagglutinin family outer membrane protein [Leptolyngbya sp. Heron Island J]
MRPQLQQPSRSLYLPIFTLCAIAPALTCQFAPPTHAQVIADGTFSTNVASSDNQNFVIDAGDRAGNNLFHSFDTFSIPTNGSAIFNNAIDIKHIVSRVTGINTSDIDGLIQANGTANLFLLNPNGILFGENASLDIGGSFLATTAESILFSDNVEFSTTDVTSASLLTISTPMRLQFAANPSPITVEGTGHNLTLDLNTSSPIRDNRPVGLQVPSGQTLAFIGGDILIEGGHLTANQGRIELGSVAQSGSVSLMPTSDGFTLDYAAIDNFGDLRFTQAASVEVSGEGSGNLHFQGRNISVLETSAIISNVLGADSGGEIRVRASESVDIIGIQTEDFPSAFFNQGEAVSTGNVGNLSIQTGRLQVVDGFVSNAISGAGNGGNLTIKANDITLIGNNVFQGNYNTGLLAQVFSSGTGQGGALSIDADNLYMQSSLISNATLAEGNAGNTVLQVDTLRLTESSQIFSGTIGQGNGGNISIDANEITITSTEKDAPFLAGIYTTSLEDGNAGNIDIQVNNRLQLTGAARISSLTRTAGTAGNIMLQAGEIEVNGAGATGGGGISDDGQLTSRITAFSETDFAAGKIDITVETLRVTNQGLISVSNLEGGDASDLSIRADQILLTDGGTLQAEVAAGNQGNILLMADSLLFLKRGGLISTNATNRATGGNIVIEAPVILGLNNSDIVANAVQGDGGNIAITTQALLGLQFRNFRTSESDITASSQFGLDGIVQIDTPDLEPNQGLVELPSELTDSSNQISTGCLVAADNSLTLSGRGGLPDAPDTLNSLAVWEDWRPLETEARTATAPRDIARTSFREATAMVIDVNGRVQFVASTTERLKPPMAANPLIRCGSRDNVWGQENE